MKNMPTAVSALSFLVASVAFVPAHAQVVGDGNGNVGYGNGNVNGNGNTGNNEGNGYGNGAGSYSFPAHGVGNFLGNHGH